MGKHIELKNLKEVDVIVVGGGSAGVLAAIASSRLGKKTLLIEKNGFLGGISTAVLDTFYGFYAPGKENKRIVEGIPSEIVNELFNRKAAFERPNTFGSGTGITYNPEILKCIYDDMTNNDSLIVLFHSTVTDVVMDGNKIKGVVVDGKEGLNVISANVVIDTSGDADVAYRAGVAYEKAGDIEPAQTLTTTFRISNVDVDKALKTKHAVMSNLMKEANRFNSYHLPREEGSIHITPIDGVMLAIMTRLDSYNPCNVISLSLAEKEGRKQALEYIRFLVEYIPGYENAKLISLSSQIGIRETRRIYGEYRLTKEDVMNVSKFDDAIGLGAAPIEDHHGGKDTKWEFVTAGDAYQIPYRTFVPKIIDGLLVAGRCFSATHLAHASCRSIGQTMTMGQAVGVAASISIDEKVEVRDISIPKLQGKLIEIGAKLELE